MLPNIVKSLPTNLFLSTNNGYVVSKIRLAPIGGSERIIPENETYNFYLLQLGICIEQAFGLLVSKCRIMRSPLELDLDNTGKAIFACASLQNFFIYEEDMFNGKFGYLVEDIKGMERAPIGMEKRMLAYLPSHVDNHPQVKTFLRFSILGETIIIYLKTR